ncbi:unnamed protein product [Owenia fusiformis]|uniref:Uncharacterized protein n=1 Tax=Owenia fusiformis TaxID=6347 RepID=A0A8J1XQ44_OWEFU|nr:unnamed protein product [Owenia fusiformis]
MADIIWNITLAPSANNTPNMVTNMTSNAPPILVPISSAQRITFFVTLILIILMTIAGNGLVFAVFNHKRRLLTISNRLVLNLSVCNFFMAIFVMPFALVSTLTETWTFGKGVCEMIGILTTFLFVACILTLLSIAVDMNYAIHKPLHYTMQVTRRRVNCFIAGIWIVAFILSIPPLLGANEIMYQRHKFTCTVAWRTQRWHHRAYGIIIVVICFLLPSIIMFSVYIRMFISAIKSAAFARQITGNSSLRHDDHSESEADLPRVPKLRRRSSTGSWNVIFHRDNNKAAKTGFIVLSAFFLSWCPYFIVVACESILPFNQYIPPPIEGIVIWIAFAGCALNPIVYAFRNKTIRVDIKKMIQHWFCKKEEPDLPPRSRKGSRDFFRRDSRTSMFDAERSNVTIATYLSQHRPSLLVNGAPEVNQNGSQSQSDVRDDENRVNIHDGESRKHHRDLRRYDSKKYRGASGQHGHRTDSPRNSKFLESSDHATSQGPIQFHIGESQRFYDALSPRDIIGRNTELSSIASQSDSSQCTSLPSIEVN